MARLKFADKVSVIVEQNRQSESKEPAIVAEDASLAAAQSATNPSYVDDSISLDDSGSVNDLLINGETKIDDFNGLKNHTSTNKTKIELTSTHSIKRKKIMMKTKLKERLQKIAEDRLTVREIFSQYVESSTLHGFSYVCTDDIHAVRRLLWAVLMVIGAIYFIVKLRAGIEEYFQFPFSTLSTVDFPGELKFPAISLCPINSYNRSFVEGSRLNRLRDRLPLEKSWSDPGFDIPGDELAALLKESSLQITDMHRYCDWLAKDTVNFNMPPNPCSAANFTSFFSYRGELCFTLNSGKPGHRMLKVDEAGLGYGYELAFDLQNEKVLSSYPYSGLRMLVHDHTEPPNMADGFVVTTGEKTYVKMQTVQTKNLQRPYSTMCGEVDFKYYQVYNQKACLHEQLTDFIGEECGCRTPFMADNGMKNCSLKKTLNCVFPARERFPEFEMRTLRCPIECEITHYESEISYTRYLHNPPTGVAEKIMTNFYNRTGKLFPVFRVMQERNLTKSQLKQYIRDNIIHVIFFFRDVKIDIHKQEATLDFYQFLGDMGGEIGLMLGASLLTFVEFVDLFILLIYHQLLRIKSTPRDIHLYL